MLVLMASGKEAETCVAGATPVATGVGTTLVTLGLLSSKEPISHLPPWGLLCPAGGGDVCATAVGGAGDGVDGGASWL